MRMDFTASTTAVLNAVTDIPTDLLIAAAIIVVGFLVGFTAGASRASTAALALIAAVSLTSLVPGALILGSATAGIDTGFLMLALAALLYAIIRRLTDPYGYGGGIVSGILGGIGLAAVVLGVWLATPALIALWPFGPLVQGICAESYRLFIVLGGLTALAFARG